MPRGLRVRDGGRVGYSPAPMNPSVAPKLVIALAVLTGLVLVAATWWRRGWGRRRVAEPSCGRCGYSVRGLASFNCPECGSDLREVGIVTPAMGRGAGPLVWAALWTLFLPWPAMALSVLLTSTVLPRGVVTDMRRTIFVQAPYLNRTIQARMTGRGVRFGQQAAAQPVPVTELTLDAGTGGGAGPMQVDLSTNAWRYRNAKRQTVSNGPFGPAAVLQWLGDMGFDTTDARIQSRAADIHAGVQEMPQAQNKFTDFGKDGRDPFGVVTAHPTFVTTMPRPIPWVEWGLPAAWVVVWLVGLLWIIRRRGKPAGP